ncbi:MAG TPA: S9 family peptidase [Candidatus Acidoferrales bacterium]|nr:S9 family peptidase [Candidatus Acidoferrales bacterium]
MRKPFSLFAVTSLFSAAMISFAPRAAAQNSSFPTTVPNIEQALSMKSVSDPQMSPDGRFVAYVQTSTDWDENAFVRQIWITVVTTGQTYQLTEGKKSCSDPQWSPDGQWLAFTSDRAASIPDTKADSTQLYIISPAGGEARQLTSVETGVDSYAWSPDGKRIAFSSEDPESDAHKARVKKYGDFHIIDSDYTMTHLWLINVPGSYDLAVPKPERLTSGDQFTVHNFRWSPDGKIIAFDATRDPALADEGTSDIYILTVADKSVHKLTDGPGPNSDPYFSPDGSQIAYTTSDGNPYYYYTNHFIAVVPAAGGMPKLLTKDFDEDPNMVGWAADGIYFEAEQRTYGKLYRLDPQSQTISRLTPDHLLTNSFSFTRDFAQMAYLAAADNAFNEVFASPVNSFVPEKLSDVSAQYAKFHLATREVVQWKSGDGTPIEGVLIKPADFDPAKKYPLLVVIHGGPTGTSRATRSPDRYYPMELFAARGALLLEPNYRGSAGYGEQFRSLNVRNLGVGDYADVISGVDYLISKGSVDPAKVGSMGWSEGGYISMFNTTYSDRFCAVSAGAGISDWMTYYVNTDITPFTRQYLHATPWKDPDVYKKTSPITYITHAHTPTLIQQGSKDARVPVPDSWELYRGLKDQGVPVKFVLFDGFGHPITKPKQLRQVTEENWEWFAHYIWGNPLPADLKP